MRIETVYPKRRDGSKVTCQECGAWTLTDEGIVDLDGPPFVFYCTVSCLRTAYTREGK